MVGNTKAELLFLQLISIGISVDEYKQAYSEKCFDIILYRVNRDSSSELNYEKK